MANGSFGGGSGTVTDPLLVEDLLDLNAIRNGLTKYYKLMNDIDMSLESLNAAGIGDSGKGWLPIGSNGTTKVQNFTGEINFNYKKIKNIYINRPDCDYVGLIASPNRKEFVLRARIEGGYIIGKNYVGAIAGEFYLDITTIKNASIKLSFLKGASYVGGVCGSCANISSSENASDVKVSINEIIGEYYIGGIVGVSRTYGAPIATRCIICIDKISALNYMGGIMGHMNLLGNGNPAVDCYVKIPIYTRLSGNGANIGEFCGNTNSTGGFVRCFSLDTAEFFSAS